MEGEWIESWWTLGPLSFLLCHLKIRTPFRLNDKISTMVIAPRHHKMTVNEKLIFVASFIWLMHWGVRVVDTIIAYAFH